MNDEPTTPEGSPPATASETPAPPRRRRLPVWARVLIAVLGGALVLSVGFDLATASPELCASCHEMQPRAESWAQSAHAGVDCVECHQTPHAWYELPQRVIDRGALLGRDVVLHLSGDYADPVDERSPDVAPVSDDVCLQCHDPNRTATSGFRILIDHPEHAKRNGSCVSCHIRTAHPVETRGSTLSLMAQCFTCHGTPEQPEASAECASCHPSGYELVPATHERHGWKEDHGDVALEDPDLCVLCHEQALCDGCHGLAMPHPAEWTDGAAEHAEAAEADPELCANCHGDSPDMCTMCHHAPYQPGEGTWVEQHSQQAVQSGAEFCIGCHSPVDCVECHVRPAG